MCHVGSHATIDQDDLQPYDQYGRMIANVFCEGKSLNSALLHNGYAEISTQYCSTSEFAGKSWAQRFGCSIPMESILESSNCDPSYPDFCISPPPPDLDCGDITQKSFTVLPPDPHRFDGDKDGIGCE